MLIINTCKAIFDLFIPPMCALCPARLNILDNTICPECLDDINRLPYIMETSSIYTEKVWAIFQYTGKIKKCLKIFKFKKRKNIIIVLEHIIKDFLRENPGIGSGVDIIVPVPMSPIDIKNRRINHAGLIAEALSKLLSVPIDRRVLIKIKNTEKQASLKREKRLRNLVNSFKVTNKNKVSGKNMLIVDDIFTTGATIDTCALELLKSKAKEVFAFTVARTL